MSPFSLGVLGSAHVASPGAVALPVAGAVAWWDFSDTSTLTLSGSEITAVADKTGNGYTLARGTSGPESTTSVSLGGGTLNIARFDGTLSNCRLEVASDLGVTGNYTHLVVARKQTWGQTGGNADLLFAHRGHSTYIAEATLFIWGGTSATVVTGDQLVIMAPQVYVRTLTSTAHSVWTGSTQRVNAVTGSAGTADTVYVGGGPSAESDWEIGEVIVYPSALDATNRATMTTHLLTKWGI